MAIAGAWIPTFCPRYPGKCHQCATFVRAQTQREQHNTKPRILAQFTYIAIDDPEHAMGRRRAVPEFRRHATKETGMNQTTSASPTLIGQFATSPIRHIALVLAGVALITLGAKIQVPFWPVPMTLQTLALMVIFAASGMRLSLEIILGYLALGLAGVPVFAGAAAGPLYFAGPTAGFLLGFVGAALIVGWAADQGTARRPLALFGAMLAGDAVIFALGFLWLGFLFTTSSGATLGADVAFASGVKPFVLADLVKLALAVVIVTGIGRRLHRG